MTLFCLRNTATFIISIPGGVDHWNQPLTWLPPVDQNDARFVDLETLCSPFVAAHVQAGRLVPAPERHAAVFGLSDLEGLAQEYRKVFGELLAVTPALVGAPPAAPAAEPPAAPVEAPVEAPAEPAADASATSTRKKRG